jgi:FKBP-type peptidyl-prolyl cis-trans isomerase FkpA
MHANQTPHRRETAVKRSTIATIALTTVTAAIAGVTVAQLNQPQAAPTNPGPPDATSYALGVDVARNVLDTTASDGVGIDRVSFFRGIADTLNDQPLALTDGQIRRALADLETEVATRAAEQRMIEDPLFRLQAEDNAAKGQSFRDRFAARDAVESLPSGVLYEPITSGDGEPAADARGVAFVYTAATATGLRFAENLSVEIGLDGMLPAVADTVRRMRTGDRWIVVIPPEAAFGIAGHETPSGAAIGPNETLVATIELLGVTP